MSNSNSSLHEVKEWKILREEPFKCSYRSLLRRFYELPDGRTTEFELVLGGPVVCVFPLTADNKVVLAKQYRPGPEAILLELPGGGVGPDETPLEAIQRELLEETGYTGDFQYVGPSLIGFYTTMVRHNFVATNCRKVQETECDEFEIIEPIELPLAEFREHLRGGQMSDVATGYMALDFLKLL